MRILTSSALAASLLLVGTAHATSLPQQPTALVVDSSLQATDSQAPSTPSITSADLFQSSGVGTLGGCGPNSQLTINLGAVTDNSTNPIGYEVTLASGKLPTGLTLPSGPILAADGVSPPRIVLEYGASKEKVTFALTVTAVDKAGNKSAASAPATIDDDNTHGCSASGGGSTGLVGLVLFAGLLARRARASKI